MNETNNQDLEVKTQDTNQKGLVKKVTSNKQKDIIHILNKNYSISPYLMNLAGGAVIGFLVALIPVSCISSPKYTTKLKVYNLLAGLIIGAGIAAVHEDDMEEMRKGDYQSRD